jgi:DNA replication protein DnaC
MTIDAETICPICDGMGFVTRNVPVGHPDFGKAFPCSCQADKIADRKANLLRKVSNLSAYDHLRFDNFNIDVPSLTANQQTSLRFGAEMAYRFAEKPDGWILFQGGYGCGKTHLAAAIGNYVLSLGHEVIFVTIPDLLDHLRGTYGSSSETSYDELFDRIRNTQVLILDDLGTESPTAWAGEKLYQLFNHRYTHRLPTVVTTNNVLEELDGRIYSRLSDVHLTQVVNMVGLPDYRLQGSNNKQEESLLQSINSLKAYSQYAFDNFNAEVEGLSPEYQSMLKAFRDDIVYPYARNPEGWILFHGGYGCGKTHLAAAIGNYQHSIENECVFVSVSDLLDYLRSTYGDTSKVSYNKLFEYVKNVPLLILDDLHADSPSSWAGEKLYQLFNYRYTHRLPTVVTTNNVLEELDGRIYSRLSDVHLTQVVNLMGFPDYRLQGSNNKDISSSLQSINSLKAYSQYTFDNFNVTDVEGLSIEHQSMLKVFRDEFAYPYARNPEGWILFQGDYGCGKTHLAAAIGNYQHSIENECVFVSVSDLLDHLRSTYGDTSKVSYNKLFEYVKNVPLLILDDLHTDISSSWASEKLYQLLDHRYINNLPTIVTTSSTLQELDGRIISRLTDTQRTVIVNMAGLPDYRQQAFNSNIADLSALDRINNLGAYNQYTFDTFNITDIKGLTEEQYETLNHSAKRAYDYAQNAQGWLLFQGDYGCGKTHLAAAIGNFQKSHGKVVLFLTVPDLLDNLRFANRAETTYSILVEQVQKIPLLILDDLGIESPTPWAMEKLYQLFNYRFIHNLPTIITTNRRLEDLDGRIFSRLVDGQIVDIVDMSSLPNFRLKDQTSVSSLRRISNLDAYRDQRFETFNVENVEGLSDDQHRVLSFSADFAQNYAQNLEGWLLFQGGYGCGKTHLAAAIGNYQLSLGREVVFLSVSDLLDHLRATYSSSSKVSYDQLFERVRNTPLLILDDLGTESPTPWAGEKLYQLFNHRYVHRLPTVITTNYSLSDLDGRIYSRLADQHIIRIVNMTILPDYRRASAEQNQSDLSNLRLYTHMTFQNFDLQQQSLPQQDAANLRRAAQTAHDYATKPQGWLVLSGVHGSGKTHLAAGIANHRQSTGQPVLLVTTADLLDYLRATFNPSSKQALDQRFHEIRTAPLLILDDLNLRTATAWAQEKLFQIIDYRYLAQLPTVITIFTDDLKNLDDRFESRFKDPRLCTVIQIAAPDYQGGWRNKRAR